MFVMPSIRISDQPERVNNNKSCLAKKDEMEDYLDKNPNTTVQGFMVHFGIKSPETAERMLNRKGLLKKIKKVKMTKKEQDEKYAKLKAEMIDYIAKNPQVSRDNLGKIFGVSRSFAYTIFKE